MNRVCDGAKCGVAQCRIVTAHPTIQSHEATKKTSEPDETVLAFVGEADNSKLTRYRYANPLSSNPRFLFYANHVNQVVISSYSLPMLASGSSIDFNLISFRFRLLDLNYSSNENENSI